VAQNVITRWRIIFISHAGSLTILLDSLVGGTSGEESGLDIEDILSAGTDLVATSG
jgi:hypothetical protein